MYSILAALQNFTNFASHWRRWKKQSFHSTFIMQNISFLWVLVLAYWHTAPHIHALWLFVCVSGKINVTSYDCLAFNKKQYSNLFFKEFDDEKENASSLVLMHPKPGPNIAFSLWLNLKIPIEDSEGIAEFNREKTSVVSVLSPSQNKLS